MIVRSSKFLALFVAATLLGWTLLAIVAVWQLSRGPISLSFLTPYIEEALTFGPDGARVRLHDTVLTWAGLERTLDVRAIGLEVLNRNGAVAATVPEMSVRFSARALLRGLVAPTRLELFGPRLRIVRRTDGVIDIGVGAVATDEAAELGGSELLAGLLRQPDRNSPSGYLRRVSIVSALIEFEDRIGGRNWTAQRADIAMFRDNKGIRADGTIALEAGGDFARFEVSGLFDSTKHTVDLGLTFDHLKPAIVAQIDPHLEPLQRLDAPLSGTLAMSLDASLVVEELGFEVRGGAGNITLPELYPAPLPVAAIKARGSASEDFRRLVIDEIALDVGGPIVKLGGTLVQPDAGIAFDINLGAAGIPIDDLAKLWPPGVATSARGWITENLKGGEATTARLALAGTMDPANPGAAQVDAATGGFEVRGTSVHYLRPMAPVTDVSASGKLDGDTLTIDSPGGTIGNLTVGASRIAIKGLSEAVPESVMSVETMVDGPVREALVLLDEKPLRFVSRLGFDSARTDGYQSAKLQFKFPLVHNLSVDQVTASASAQLSNFSAPAIAFGADMAHGDFELAVDTQRLVAKGNAVLAGVPVALVWTEDFTAKTPLRTRYQVQARLEDAARENILGVATGPILAGPVGVDLTYEIARGRAAKGVAQLDLTDATMALDDFGWHKSAGAKGSASIEFTVRDGTIGEIPNFTVAAPHLTASGRVGFARNRGRLAVSELELPRLVLGESDVSLRVAFADDGVPDITLGGERFDARALVGKAFARGAGETPAMRLRVADDRPLRAVRLGEQTVLQNPSGRLFHDGKHWTNIDLFGSLSNGGAIDLRLQTVDGRREVLLESDDGGGLLRALDWINTIEGGALKVKGSFAADGADETLTGQLSLDDFKIIHGTVMARILSLASFTGIPDAMSGSGLSFRRAEVPFEVTDAEIRVGDAKAHGADIGILASGRIDRTADTIELEGEIAPAYTINSLVKDIPVIGDILTGGGDAVFAATYKVKGPIKDPEVSVNPLTVLTPGILRRLVSGFGKGANSQDGSGEPQLPQRRVE